ncbi:MAG: FecR domain-containing protein [Opitutaceae bacterium]
MATPESQSTHSRDAIDTAAAEWLALRDAGWTAKEEAAWARWCAADPRHSAAWKEFTDSWHALDATRDTAQADDLILRLSSSRRRRHRRLTVMSVVLAAAAALAFVAYAPRGQSGPDAPEVTLARALPLTLPGAKLLRPAQEVLPDGTTVQLKGDAAIEVDFQPAYRVVRLLRGEAHFSVTKDPSRPFVVKAQGFEVRAVGTAFAVKLGSNDVDVVVTEGRVSVEPPASLVAPSLPVLVAGQRVVLPVLEDLEPVSVRPQVETLQVSDLEERLAWRGTLLELSGTRLGDVVVLFNRENRLQLSIADPELAGRQMSGIVRPDNAEALVRVLEANYGVTAERRDENHIVLRKQP